jgi:hypothetical protein
LWFSKIGVLELLFEETKKLGIVGIFIAGFFFTSVFTVVPAAAVLGEIAVTESPIVIGLVAGLGAVISDLFILLFIKKNIVKEVESTLSEVKEKPWGFLHLEALKFLNPIIGTIIIATPLPDEVGLFLLGFSNVSPKKLAPLLFIINSIGIFTMILFARNIVT